jgi:hypothetical protein
VEPNLLRDALIVVVFGALLLVARVPWRIAVLILAAAVAATVLVDAVISGLVGSE